jgi:hypothetical protein
MMKIEQSATEAPALLFSAQNDPAFGLMDYVASVERHFVKHGLETIFFFKKDSDWINILTGHPRFSREDIQLQCRNLFNNRNNASLTLPQERYDIFDANLNLPWSAAYILNSVSPELRAQLLTKSGDDYNKGPIVWMILMTTIQSSSFHGNRALLSTFQDRKLKDEPGENVLQHTIKLRNDYKRLQHANLGSIDAVQTCIESLMDSSCSTFNVWCATKRITISEFVREHHGKLPSALVNLPNVPTVDALCNDADDYYKGLFDAGQWTAVLSKQDKEAAPAAFLLEKLSKQIDKMTLRKPGTCYTCGKAGHKSPDCPDKDPKKRRTRRPRKDTRNRPRPEWQSKAPKSGDANTQDRDGRTFQWCATCGRWSTTHGTSTHKDEETKKPAPKVTFADAAKKESKGEKSGNLAEIVPEDDSQEQALALGAWCGIASTSSENMDDQLGAWITHMSKRALKRAAATCTSCNAVYYCPTPTDTPICYVCSTPACANVPATLSSVSFAGTLVPSSPADVAATGQVHLTPPSLPARTALVPRRPKMFPIDGPDVAGTGHLDWTS